VPTIQAFRGLRYDLGHVGSLSDVVAPPYDVIDAPMQDGLYKKHPANVVRLILNREEQGDQDPNIRYNRAAQFLRNWQREGVMKAESQPAIYYYQQAFDVADKKITRSGFICRVRLEPFGEGKIYPHEETHSAAKADRLKLFNATKANLSQIFSIYPDPQNETGELLAAAAQGIPPIEATDHLGVVHRLSVITDLNVIGKLSALMDPKPAYIADGHHRYETACNYRQQLRDAGELTDDHPANYTMMMCVGMNDPGMVVLPTHRMFRGLPRLSSDELVAKLGDHFSCRIAGEGSDLAAAVWDEIESGDEQGTLGLYTAKDHRWVVANITDEGREKMAQLSGEQSADWQRLGVSILHKLVVERLLGGTGLPKPMYVHGVDEVVQAIEEGDTVGRDATGQQGEGGDFPLVALVMPAMLDHIRAISEHGERMPAKSTYFYPKLLSGLVINPLTH
jgi:uncharacterized protein (DUF1015 family)